MANIINFRRLSKDTLALCFANKHGLSFRLLSIHQTHQLLKHTHTHGKSKSIWRNQRCCIWQLAAARGGRRAILIIRECNLCLGSISKPVTRSVPPFAVSVCPVQAVLLSYVCAYSHTQRVVCHHEYANATAYASVSVCVCSTARANQVWHQYAHRNPSRDQSLASC